MSDKEIVVTREMVKAIVRDFATRVALWTIIAASTTILTGAIWIGTISADVSRLKLDEKKTKTDIEKVLEISNRNSVILESISKTIDQNRIDDSNYRVRISKDIQEFYRKNPNL